MKLGKNILAEFIMSTIGLFIAAVLVFNLEPSYELLKKVLLTVIILLLIRAFLQEELTTKLKI